MSRKSHSRVLARSAVFRRLASSRFRVTAGLLLLALWPSPPSAQTALTAIEATIAATYNEIGEISSSKLDSLLASADSSRLVLFDSRPVVEFEQSHIRNAIRVNPDASADSFFLAHDSVIRDKDVVLYCSVGYRSSILAARLQAAGARERRDVCRQPARRALPLVQRGASRFQQCRRNRRDPSVRRMVGPADQSTRARHQGG